MRNAILTLAALATFTGCLDPDTGDIIIDTSDMLDNETEDLLNDIADLEELIQQLEDDLTNNIDQSSCSLFPGYDGQMTTSQPTFHLSASHVFSPYNDLTYFTTGEFHTASGCGTGYTIDSLLIFVDNIPEDTPDTEMSVTVMLDGIMHETTCHGPASPRKDCMIANLNQKVLSGHAGVKLWFSLQNMPDVVEHPLNITIVPTWTDLDTGDSQNTHYYNYGDEMRVTFTL